MRPVITAVVLACLMMASMAGTVSAEPRGFHVSLSPYAGYTIFDSNVNLKNDVNYGGRLGLMYNWHLGAEGTFGITRAKTDPDDEEIKVQNIGVDLIYNILPAKLINPYVLAGWGQIYGRPEGTATDREFNGWEFAGGAKVRLWRSSSTRGLLRLEARDVVAKWDPPVPEENKARHTWFLTAGLTLDIGPDSDKDSDGDGVPDRTDTCPDTPPGAIVDLTGCPLDDDGDGVPDGIDQCADTPAGAVVDDVGCPVDDDGDGVANGIDQCPDTPAGATVDAAGCPVDSDGDGVPDGIDQCADTPTGAVVDATGCPLDGDGDGVPDGIDQCPNTPEGTSVDEVGCAISVEEAVLLDVGILAVSVNFALNKAAIKSDSYHTLNSIAEALAKHPELQVEIGGYTDSSGAAAYNQQLSEKRANAVRDYLLEKYPAINPEQLSAVGYGEENPVASNDTAEGKAANRRVEFKVLNQ